jgi:hypothetical protein
LGTFLERETLVKTQDTNGITAFLPFRMFFPTPDRSLREGKERLLAIRRLASIKRIIEDRLPWPEVAGIGEEEVSGTPPDENPV